MLHTFWSWLITYENIKQISLVLRKIQSTHDYVLRWKDRQTNRQSDGQWTRWNLGYNGAHTCDTELSTCLSVYTIGIDHDTVCAGVVCAATPSTARVRPAIVRPLAAAPAGSTSAVPGVAAQTTTAQTVWVVNFYSTTKMKQYTTINPAKIMTMSHHAETPWLATPLWWWNRP